MRPQHHPDRPAGPQRAEAALGPATMSRLRSRQAGWVAQGWADLGRGIGLVMAGFAAVLVAVWRVYTTGEVGQPLAYGAAAAGLLGLPGVVWGVVLAEHGLFGLVRAWALGEAIAAGAVGQALSLGRGDD